MIDVRTAVNVKWRSGAPACASLARPLPDRRGRLAPRHADRSAGGPVARQTPCSPAQEGALLLMEVTATQAVRLEWLERKARFSSFPPQASGHQVISSIGPTRVVRSCFKSDIGKFRGLRRRYKQPLSTAMLQRFLTTKIVFGFGELPSSLIALSRLGGRNVC
jgi:hypothetical protein